MSQGPPSTGIRPPDPGARAGGREPRLADLWASARPYRKRILAAVVLGTALAAVIAFVWPPTYKATATILPPSEDDTGFSVTSVLRNLSVPGVRIPTRSGPGDIVMSVLESRRLAGTLVDRFDLQKVYGKKTRAAAIRELQSRASFDMDPNGSVAVTVKDRSARRAADLANAFIDELDRFNREVRMTKGRRTRIFVEQRLEETRKRLAEAEQALKDYQSEHRAIALTPEQSSAVETAAQLFAAQAALQVQLGVAREYATEQSEDVRRLRQRLDQVNREIAGLPALGLELARMMREMKVQEQVFALLSAQYQEAQINEVRDVATVELLDTAVPPDRPWWPRRGRLIALGFALSLIGSLAWVAWDVRRTHSAG